MTTETPTAAHLPETAPAPVTYPNPLGLISVLPATLPTALGTLDAPDTYRVDAVFNRRPQAEEVTTLQAPETAEALTEAGYPSVTLRVSDRRLEIANTNLSELKSGLATFLADHLAAITAQIRKEELSAQTRLMAAADAEGSRAEAVAREAEQITFDRTEDTRS